MRRFFPDVIQPILDCVRPGRIAEIGVAEGGHSQLLAAWCAANSAHLDIIDTSPRLNVTAFLERFGTVAEIHVGKSLEVLPRLSRPDVVCIDGDHNWYTVYNELSFLFDGGSPVCILHDTGWPYGRRDLYYEPEGIPDEYRQPWRRGPLLPHEPKIADVGINPHLCHAIQEGGVRNGVQTAVEDFVARPGGEFRIVTIPVLFGLTVLASVERIKQCPHLNGLLDTLDLNMPLRALLQLEETERCYGIAAAQRLGPLPPVPGEPYAQPVCGRSFSPALPAETLSEIQRGTMQYKYRDRALYKSPFDLALYLRLLGQLRPATVIEIGTAEGGSALWFADMMAVLGQPGQVISIDQAPCPVSADSRVCVIQGDAANLQAFISSNMLASLPKPWLVVDDSAHTYEVTIAVLRFFDTFLSPGDYVVVEDGVVRGLPGGQYLAYRDGPARAISTFLGERGADYEIDVATCDYYGFNVTYNPNGWLRRK